MTRHLLVMLNMVIAISLGQTTEEKVSSAGKRTPTVQIFVPSNPWEKTKTEEELVKEDPTDVEEFSDEKNLFNRRDDNFNPFGPSIGTNFGPGIGGTNFGPNPVFPAGGPFTPGVFSDLQAFTARRAIDQEIFPGNKVRFLDTVIQIGRGWNNLTSEFVCETPGIFFFTFTACGERNRHFRITLKHNAIGVVSAYGDVSGYQMATNSVILRLLAGDRVYLELNDGGIYEVTTITGRAYNTFTGFRIL